MLCWLVLGFDLSWEKAQLGGRQEPITWTSVTYHLTRTVVTAAVKDQILDDVRKDLEEMWSSNVIPIKVLRRAIGRAVCVSSLLYCWRPFVAMLWAPLSATATLGNPPLNCIWRRSVEVPLRWISAFLAKRAGSLTREFDVLDHNNLGVLVSITMDASPWGGGAILKEDGEIIEFIAVTWTAHDEEAIGHAIGDCRGQQAWEAFIALISLRHWAPRWRRRRCKLQARSDSISALTVLLSFKAGGTAPAKIARELALDVADSLYRPDVVSHIPGIANIPADVISRWAEPVSRGFRQLPVGLAWHMQTFPVPRSSSWWRTSSTTTSCTEPATQYE